MALLTSWKPLHEECTGFAIATKGELRCIRNRLDLHKTCIHMQKQKMFTKLLYSEMSLQFSPRCQGLGPERRKTSGSRPHRYTIASKLPSIKHVKRAKTAQLRASAHDYLKKTPRLGSQSILPSTSFALAQQASSREYSKAFTKDDDDTTSLFY